MNSLRGMLFYIVLGISVIPLSLALLLMVPFTGNEARYDLIRLWGRFMLAALSVICGIRTRVSGLENCPEGAAVVLSKHQSAWECFWLGCCLPKRCAYVYKESLNRIPFFGWAVWSIGLLSINRSDPRSAFRTFMTKGVDFLNRGWWIALFPEGTRVPPGKHVKYKSGGVRLAASQGAPILPVALNSGLCWPKDSIAKLPGTITVTVGRPIATAGRPVKEVEAEVEQWIEAESDRLIAIGRK